MTTLRPNQTEPVRIGIEFFKQKKSVPSIEVCPTAFGKSIVIAAICKELGEKMLVIQPSKELLIQNYNKFILLGGKAEIFSASMNSKEIGDITYATIGSIKALGSRFKELGITKIIIDECDRYPRESTGMFRTFVADCKATHILGLTATPLKLQVGTTPVEDSFFKGYRTCSRLVMLTTRNKTGTFFKDIIYVAQVKEMVDLGFWCKLHYEVYDFDTGLLKYNTSASDFTQESMEKAYEKECIEEKIINWVRYSTRKSILVAVPSVVQAQALSKRIPNSVAIWGDMSADDRTAAVEGFKSLEIRVAIQVNVLSVGFDHPKLDCVICGRPTASLSWWYQFVGRLTRIDPDKVDGLVVDFVGNTDKFGKLEDLKFIKEDGLWKLYGENGYLLTGVPLDEIGKHTQISENVKIQENLRQLAGLSTVIMPFGKYKGKEVKTIPQWYMTWLLNNITWNSKNQHIKNEILRHVKKEEKSGNSS